MSGRARRVLRALRAVRAPILERDPRGAERMHLPCAHTFGRFPRSVQFGPAVPDCRPDCNCDSCLLAGMRNAVTFSGRRVEEGPEEYEPEVTWYRVRGGWVSVSYRGRWYPAVRGVCRHD